MTETNINALCSVEAVFDGVDIEVTVEFSAGGGTTDHSELTEESRALPAQHPASSITYGDGNVEETLIGQALFNGDIAESISDIEEDLTNKENTGVAAGLIETHKSTYDHSKLAVIKTDGDGDLFLADDGDYKGISKENIIGLTVDDSPEFADTQITGLNSVTNGGSITDAIYNWFKGVFPSLVDSSVKSYIIGLLTVVKDLATRVGVLEDNVILNYATAQAITSLSITQDKNGNALNLVDFDVYIYGENVDSLNSACMTINNNNNSIYWNGVTNTMYAFFIVYVCGYINNRFEAILKFRKLGNNYQFHQLTNDRSLANTSRYNNYGGYVTSDIGNVTRIDLTSINWKVGTKIKIVKR